MTAPLLTATMAGGAVLVTLTCSALPAQAEAVTWDANWNTSDAPADIPDANVLSDIPSDFTFLSASGSPYSADGQTIVRLADTAAGATNVSVVGGAGMTTADLSVSEGPITVDTWMKVTGGSYATLVGGSYAQNYSGGEPASFTGDSHILLTSEGGSSATVDYIIGGNYMDAQDAPFTGNSYISVQSGTVNGSIVGGGTSAHIRKAIFNGDSGIWIYTPLSGTAANRFEFPGNVIVGGNAAINNYAPTLEQTGDSRITIDLSSYAPGGSAAAMEKTIIGDAWMLANTTSTHTGNVELSINGTDADGANVSFAQPVVAGSWFSGSGTGSLSGTTTLSISGGAFSESIIGGSRLAASDGTARQQSGNIALSISGGEVNGTVYGGSYSANTNAESLAAHGDISISLLGGSINGSVYAGGGLASGVQSGISAASTTVEIGNDVTLGSITISGGVENANVASSIAGSRTLRLSGSSDYSNLASVTFREFNVVENATAATLNLSSTAGSSFTKQGGGALSLSGGADALQQVSALSVDGGTLDTGASTLTQGGQGLSSLSVAAGAALTTSALTLADAASLSLGLASSPLSQALVAVTGELSYSGQSPLALSLSGVENLASGSDATLLSWGSAATPLTLSNISWVNKGDGLQAYELGIDGNSLILRHVEELTWDDSGSWNAGVDTDGKAAIFNTPATQDATITISGAVQPQSIVVNNAADTTYSFESDGTGSIAGDTSLIKENEGSLVMGLTNTYTGGTTVNGGTLNAAAAGALGSGAVLVNEGGTLVASAEGALSDNTIALNGGTLRYEVDETRSLGSAPIGVAEGSTPQVAVATGNTVTWEYADGAELESALGNGLELSGGGTLRANAVSATEGIALEGALSLTGEGTTLEFGSLGVKSLGSESSAMPISLGEGTTLRVQQPQADAPTTIHADLEGSGTLEFASAATGADNMVRLKGDGENFTGSVNLGSAPGVSPIALAAGTPELVLDYSEGSPVGGDAATLNLNGMSFAIVQPNGTATTTAAAVNLNADTTQYAQTAGLENTFSGAVRAASGTTWTLDATPADGGQSNILTGDLSALAGTLAATGKEGSIARWQLGSAASATTPVIAATLSAENEYNEFALNFAEEVTLAGAVTGAANLTQQGAGKLVLTGDNTTTGTLRIAEGSTVQLGNPMEDGQWGVAAGSSLAGAGTLILSNGTLAGPLSAAAGDTPIVSVDITAGNSVDMGGSAGELITGSITLGEGATLRNVAGSILDKELNLTLAEANIGKQTAAATAMVQFADASPISRAVTSSLGSETAAINLDLSNNDVVNLLREHRAEGAQSYLTLTNGQLITAADYSNVSFGQNMDILDSLGLRVARVDGGSLVLSGTAQGVYMAGAGADATSVTGYAPLSAYQAVAVLPGESLTLTLDGAPDAALDGEGAVINNLLGGDGSDFVVNNTSDTDELATVILNNSLQAIDPVPGGLPGDPRGANTTFGGDIAEAVDGGDVAFIKTGEGMLTIGGRMDATQLTVREGGIVLNGTDNDLERLSLEGGTLTLGSGSDTDVDTVADTVPGATLRLEQGAELELSESGSRLEATQLEGSGTLVVSGDLALAQGAQLNGVALNLDGGTLTLEETNAHSIAALNGNGSLSGTGSSGASGLAVTGSGGRFGGALAGSGTLTVAAGAEQQFADSFVGGSGWNLTNNGRMSLELTQAYRASAPLALDALTLAPDSVTTLALNLDAPTQNLLTLGSISVAPTATVNLNANAADNIVRADSSYVLGRVSGGQPAGELTTIVPSAAGIAFMLVDAERSTLSVDADGNLRLNLVTRRTNALAPLGSNGNSLAGAELLWDAAFNGNTAVGTDIRRLLEALNNPANAGEADRILAAASGAGAAVLSTAFASDVERQLRALRNRSTTTPLPARRMAAKGCTAAGAPRFAAWINGEGDHRKLDASGFLPGYSLSSWGGTVGVDVSCSDEFVGGLAFTALYGDLDAHSADHAKGDFDRYYVTAFARMTRHRWQHTLVGTIGRLDADLDRRVSYGTGSYRTHGSTDGWGYGLLYEIGYNIPMDEDAAFTLQPVANVAWRYVDVDGYTERGSDAALRVNGQDYNVVTFGAGLRTQAEVGERWFNRRALLEGRALVKVDTGDRSGEAWVAMLGGGGRGDKVRSAKLNAVGVELGAGLNIPMGDGHSAIFIDGSAELRNEYSNLNGTIGYRFEF